MRKQADKKLISFVNSHLINRLVKDEADIQNRSESAIIENRLLDSFLPDESNARFIAATSLYGDGGGVGNALEAIFSNNAAGLNHASKYDNLLPIVEFAHVLSCSSRAIPTGKERERVHFCSQLDSVATMLEELAADAAAAGDVVTRVSYQNEAKWARALLEEFETEPQYTRYSNIFQLVLNNWDVLKGWSITYRLLTDLAAMEKDWTDNANTRTELLRLLKEVASEWH